MKLKITRLYVCLSLSNTNSCIFRLIYTTALFSFSFSFSFELFPGWMRKYVCEMGIEPETYLFEVGEITSLYSMLMIENVK